MTQTKPHVRALSRRLRAVLIVLAPLGAVLLVWTDRTLVAPRWNRHFAASDRAAGRDFAQYHRKRFVVVRVVDGDTLHIGAPDEGAPTTRVRLLGIDAPELAHDGGAAMYFAREATEFVVQRATGQQITVYLDETLRTRGKYGRLLAYVELPDGQFLNELLVSEGYAYADPRFAHSYLHRYRQLESGARALNKGLWAAVKPEQMPFWRQPRN